MSFCDAPDYEEEEEEEEEKMMSLEFRLLFKDALLDTVTAAVVVSLTHHASLANLALEISKALILANHHVGGHVIGAALTAGGASFHLPEEHFRRHHLHRFREDSTVCLSRFHHFVLHFSSERATEELRELEGVADADHSDERETEK